MDDLLSEFLTETAENLSVLDVEIVQLEQNPNDPNLLSNIFRLVHTIKGTCGFLGLPRLEAVAHATENVLGRFRAGELEVTPEAVSLILRSLDRIKYILSVLEETEAEPEGDDEHLIQCLRLLEEGRSPAEEGVDGVAATEPAADATSAVGQGSVGDPSAVGDEVEELANSAPDSVPAIGEGPALGITAGDGGSKAGGAGESRAVAVADAGRAAAGQSGGAGQPGRPDFGQDPQQEAKESSVANQSIRVSVDLLENLMTMVSELVLNRNQLLQILRNHKESEFAAPLQRLNHVVSELQEGVMKTRMQPIGNAWAKLPRIVRDVANDLGKRIELQMHGAETELDRQVLELIKDPLTHMVRNSADHGIELPDQRAAAGKPETGRIHLNAYHEGGHIIIEITDNGRGINVEKVREKALRNGLVSEAEVAGMSDQQIQQFIFKAGFSTAEEVTNLSGRGVGMDVVRTNIEKIGGTIELKSIEGRGSTFVIKIPLTLAIVSALIVESADERFAIPQISVVELVRASAESEHRIERIKGTPVLRLRDRLLPLVSLRELLKLDQSDDTDKEADGESFIVVTQVGAYTFGIMVDRVFDTEEIVVKPVAPIMRHIEMFSGNTILGDGSVIMILDPNGIAASTGEVAMGDSMAEESQKSEVARGDEKTALLLFRAGDRAPKAVPLSLVARLEDIDLGTVETSNGTPMVQYRGRLMPLIPCSQNHVWRDEGRQPVLVFADGDRSMGLVVDEILDIVEDTLNLQLTSDTPGMMGSAIINGKATDIVDVGYFLGKAFRDWFSSGSREAYETEAQRRILLIDDSPFFRNLLAPLLTVSGYHVTTVDSAQDALKLCESGQTFDVIVSDIEMPGMSGFELAERLRTDERWQDVPLVALSSHATPKDLDRGREAGFTDYVAKFDRDALLQTLSETLSETRGAA